MADIFDKKMRSAVMNKVRSKSNKSTELRLIEIFLAQRCRETVMDQRLCKHKKFCHKTQYLGLPTLVAITYLLSRKKLVSRKSYPIKQKFA